MAPQQRHDESPRPKTTYRSVTKHPWTEANVLAVFNDRRPLLARHAHKDVGLPSAMYPDLPASDVQCAAVEAIDEHAPLYIGCD